MVGRTDRKVVHDDRLGDDHGLRDRRPRAATIGPGPTDGAGRLGRLGDRPRRRRPRVRASDARRVHRPGTRRRARRQARRATSRSRPRAPCATLRAGAGWTTITGLHFVSGRDPLQPRGGTATFDEPSVVVAARPDARRRRRGLGALDTVTIASSVLSASVGGSLRGSSGSVRPTVRHRWQGGGHRVVELTVDLDADASKVADRLRRSWARATRTRRATGRITGQVLGERVHRRTTRRDLKIDANADVPALLERRADDREREVCASSVPSPAKPLALTLTAMVNRGTVRVDGTPATSAAARGPWSTRVTIRGLDTSPLLTNKRRRSLPDARDARHHPGRSDVERAVRACSTPT